MTNLLRHLRAPLIGVVALIFSAGIAFAAQPTSPGATGLANAATHAGKTVPVDATDEQAGDQNEDTDTEDTTDTGDSGSSDHCTVDLTQDASVLAGLNHGSVVCSAAHQDPPDGYAPDGFANHGAWVSSFAKSKSHGGDAPTNKGHQSNH